MFCEGEGGGVVAPPEPEELVDASPVGGDLRRRSATDSKIPVRAARV